MKTNTRQSTRSPGGRRSEMLVLSRKNDECIYIGSHIKVKVISCEDGRVKLGIDAPPSVKIHREEIFEMIREENRKAISMEKGDISDLPVFSKR